MLSAAVDDTIGFLSLNSGASVPQTALLLSHLYCIDHTPIIFLSVSRKYATKPLLGGMTTFSRHISPPAFSTASKARSTFSTRTVTRTQILSSLALLGWLAGVRWFSGLTLTKLPVVFPLLKMTMVGSPVSGHTVPLGFVYSQPKTSW